MFVFREKNENSSSCLKPAAVGVLLGVFEISHWAGNTSQCIGNAPGLHTAVGVVRRAARDQQLYQDARFEIPHNGY